MFFKASSICTLSLDNISTTYKWQKHVKLKGNSMKWQYFKKERALNLWHIEFKIIKVKCSERACRAYTQLMLWADIAVLPARINEHRKMGNQYKSINLGDPVYLWNKYYIVSTLLQALTKSFHFRCPEATLRSIPSSIACSFFKKIVFSTYKAIVISIWLCDCAN